MRHSFEEKLNIVSRIKSDHPIESLGRLGIYPIDIRTWVRRYNKYGESMARLKKKTALIELEKLQAENLRLRAENVLLKK